MIPNHRNTDDLIEQVSQRAVKTSNLIQGNLAVITAGNPVWVAGMTNMIRVMSL
jgi:pyruvate kinase